MLDSKQFKQGINDEESYTQLSQSYCQLTSSKEFTKSFLKQITETLKSKKFSGSQKFYALRTLRDCVATNKSAIVNDLANSKDLLALLKEFALFEKGNKSDDRGFTMFEKTDSIVGNHFLRLVLECIFTWAEKFKKDSKGNPTRFKILYQDLIDQKVKFPSEFIFFPQTNLQKSQEQQSIPNQDQSQRERALSLKSSQNLSKIKKLSPQEIDQIKTQYNNFCQSFFSELSVIQETLREAQEPEEFIQDILESYINIFQGTIKSLEKLANEINDLPEFSSDEKFRLNLINDFIINYKQLVMDLKKSGYLMKKYQQFQKTILDEIKNLNPITFQIKQLSQVQQPEPNQIQDNPPVSQKILQPQTEISRDLDNIPSGKELGQVDNQKKTKSYETPAWDMGQIPQKNQDNWDAEQKFDDFKFGDQKQKSEISQLGKFSQRGFEIDFKQDHSKHPSSKEINFTDQQKKESQDPITWDFNQIAQNNIENWGLDKKLEDFQFGEQKQRSEVSQTDKLGIEDHNFDFTQMSQIFFQNNEQNKLSFGNEKDFVDKQIGFNDFDFGQFNSDWEKQNQNPNDNKNLRKNSKKDISQELEYQTNYQDREEHKENQQQKQLSFQKDKKDIKSEYKQENFKIPNSAIHKDIQEDSDLQTKQNLFTQKLEQQPIQSIHSNYNVQDEQQNQISLDYTSKQYQRNTNFDEFSEKFDALSLSTLSVHDFPLKNQTIEEKRQYSGYIITYNPFYFNLIENYRLNATQLRRLKIGCFKTRAAIFVSPELEIGVISKFLYHEVTSKYFLKLTLVIGNKSSKPLINCQINYFGDNSQSLWVQPLRQPKKHYLEQNEDQKTNDLIVQSKKQIFQDIVIQYHNVPLYPLEANLSWQDDVNQMKANFILPTFLAKFMKFTNFVNYTVFKNRWHLKRYSILRSEIIKFNSKIIRHPTTFKKYFPELTELSSLQEFVSQQGNQIKDYKLGGIFILQSSQIEFMLKIIVRPNLTGLFKIIASSTYQLLTENILHNLVYIFSIPKQ